MLPIMLTNSNLKHLVLPLSVVFDSKMLKQILFHMCLNQLEKLEAAKSS